MNRRDNAKGETLKNNEIFQSIRLIFNKTNHFRDLA